MANTPLEIKLFDALKRIANDYMTPNQIRRASEREYGLSHVEALEYIYENIQQEAKLAIKGLRIKRS